MKKTADEIFKEEAKRLGMRVTTVEPRPLGPPRKRRAKATSLNGKTRGTRAKR